MRSPVGRPAAALPQGELAQRGRQKVSTPLHGYDAEDVSPERRRRRGSCSWSACGAAAAVGLVVVAAYLLLTEPVGEGSDSDSGSAAAAPLAADTADGAEGSAREEERRALRSAQRALEDARATIGRLKGEVRRLRGAPPQRTTRAGGSGGGGSGSSELGHAHALVSSGAAEGHQRPHGEDSEASDEGGGHVPDPDEEAVTAHDAGLPGYAFVNVISVEVYVDGAIVMAQSFQEKSPMVKSGAAALVCIVARDAISPPSLARLRAGGWRILEVDSMAKHVPKAHWKDSFDKLYLFGLTQFRRVVFCDSDMLVLEDPDKLLRYKLPNASYVGAIGNPPTHRRGPYFQTGMLIINPSKEVFREIIRQFRAESLPKNKGGIYNTLNSRDGMLMRSFFKARYIMVDSRYSKHVAPWESLRGIVMTHFRGSFKPWNDPEMFIKDEKRGSKEFGPAYRLWWDYYDRFHLREIAALADTAAWGPKGSPVDPKTRVWMLRNTKQEFTMWRWPALRAHRNNTREGLAFAVSDKGESCQQRCARADGRSCDLPALNFTQLADCSTVRRAFAGHDGGCTSCDYAVHRSEHPGAEAPLMAVGGRCLVPFWHDPRLRASCTARMDEVRRLCPCIRAADADARPQQWDGSAVEVLS